MFSNTFLFKLYNCLVWKWNWYYKIMKHMYVANVWYFPCTICCVLVYQQQQKKDNDRPKNALRSLHVCPLACWLPWMFNPLRRITTYYREPLEMVVWTGDILISKCLLMLIFLVNYFNIQFFLTPASNSKDFEPPPNSRMYDIPEYTCIYIQGTTLTWFWQFRKTCLSALSSARCFRLCTHVSFQHAIILTG